MSYPFIRRIDSSTQYDNGGRHIIEFTFFKIVTLIETGWEIQMSHLSQSHTNLTVSFFFGLYSKFLWKMKIIITSLYSGM